MTKKEQFIEERIEAMTLEQKVGQCLVLGFVGTMLTPEILRRVREYYPSGIRGGLYWRMRDARHDPGCTPPEFAHRMLRAPKGSTKDFIPDVPPPYCPPADYCKMVNRIKEEALNNGLGHPLHFTFDHEGDQSADFYTGGGFQTPSAMGMASLNDPNVVYEMHKAIGEQYRHLGFSWSHSMVLDVNTNPANPEISVRAFGKTAEDALPYQLAAFKGWRDAGVIATGKHFPGRGESLADAHAGLPVINLSREEMEEHLEPYRALIAEGLPSIMTAHTAYPQLEPEDIPATLSKRILTGILKEELGFKGAITTDAMAMGGIISRYEFSEACIMSLNAGADLLLIREEGQIIDELFPDLVQAVEDGRIPLERIEDANRRSLGVKYDYKFFEDNSPVGIMDPAEADAPIKDPAIINTIKTTSEKVVNVLRDENNILPLKPDTKVLLIEQMHQMHLLTNTQECHPSLFWKKMLGQSDNVAQVECNMTYPAADQERAKARLDEADVIVITNYYGRRFLGGNDFTKEVHTWGKPVIVVTNSPYPFTVEPEYKTVLVTYGCSPYLLEQAAKLIYGG